MKKIFIALLLVGCTPSHNPNDHIHMSAWVTNGDRSLLLNKIDTLVFEERRAVGSVINLDTATTYQTMDGFGYSLTGGSAYLINQKLNAEDRTALIKELFEREGNSIGISYLRVSIGASDLDDHVFSYNDLSAGKTDLELKGFSIDADRTNLIPVLKEILAVSPDIKIMGSPWSAPVWMKDNHLPKGGKLEPKYFAVYAQYFVRYIQEMKKEGITIDAVTLQNEPEHPGNTPSMTMTPSEQAEFVKLHLGPAFKTAGINTRIIVFDHNCDHPDYPIAVLNDAEAKSFIDGSAFHMYLGDISAMTIVHNAHPDKNVYFTEQWTSGKGDFGGDLRWHVKNLIIGAPRNWSRNVIEWNLAADEEFNPHTGDGGCNLCQGALTINSKTGVLTRNVSYYIIAHASKFVQPGAIRVKSEIVDNLYNVGFVNPDGTKVLIVLNDNETDKTFSISDGKKSSAISLKSGAVGTYVWKF